MQEVMSEEEWKERSVLSGLAYLSRGLGNLEKLDAAMRLYHLTPKGQVVERINDLTRIITEATNWMFAPPEDSWKFTMPRDLPGVVEELCSTATAKRAYLSAIVEFYRKNPSETQADINAFESLADPPPPPPLVRRASFSRLLKTSSDKADKAEEADVPAPVQRKRAASLSVSGTPEPQKTLPLGKHYQFERADPLKRSTHHIPKFRGLGMTALLNKWVAARGDGSTTLPFFYWLEEQGPDDLDMPSVAYLNEPEKRKRHLLFVVNGRFISAESKRAKTPFTTVDMGSLADARGMDRCIFVLSPDDVLFAGAYSMGEFHHSSFLAGKQVKSAGQLCIMRGRLVGITPKSGHYKPGEDDLCAALRFFTQRGVNLAGVDIWYPAYGEPDPEMSPFRLNAKDFLERNGRFDKQTTPRAPKYLLAHGRPDPAYEALVRQAAGGQ